mmetsp:Transcript_129352/g.374598  ORF Transcript_129352/g.374598 Transcript_129352/m.374598 type:complete len:412 (+) Transcript_129352:58-1293(+)|eukprot:CAMPEP_0176055154 /NCGR_PEP_ID=MMETSP0120_2-20121206/27451_1 /TAXON_ID=160619 /ORGANISM="Kryptoperidinium foliaceum, Strain CCMP 1326" /LENGTH=411 /DNA_ID=CAMNT_0017388635 /DNA_START=50 /DNA_END=1285 /DNA_ORIENTATION=+
MAWWIPWAPRALCLLLALDGFSQSVVAEHAEVCLTDDASLLQSKWSPAAVRPHGAWGGGARAPPAPVQWPNADSQIPMKDVRRAIERLTKKGSAFTAAAGRNFPPGYNHGHVPSPEHFQGVQRRGNYIYISGSGETAGQAQIIVLEMASRAESGPMARRADSDFPQRGDRVVNTVSFDSEYWHAGGFSIFGDVLVVGAEAGCSLGDRLLGKCQRASRIHFFDLADPRKPKKLPYTAERSAGTAGAVALTQEVDGRYLLMVGGIDSEELDFYRSTRSSSLSSDPGFCKFTTWEKSALLCDAGVSSKYYSYQNLNFVRQADGRLFLLGLTRTSELLGDDVVDTFVVSTSSERAVTMKKVGSATLSCPSFTCNMLAAGGVFVDTAEELIIYATDNEPSDGKIYVTEFSASAPAT